LFRKFAEILAFQGAPTVANGKNLQSKIFNYFFWTPLGSTVELAYRYIFSFKFILSCQQSDIIPIVCHRCLYSGGKFAASFVDTGGNLPLASLSPVANLPPVSLTMVANSPPVSTTPAKLVAKFADGVVDTGGKFAAVVVDTGGNFTAGVVDTGDAS
jgi:hypothetical protein